MSFRQWMQLVDNEVFEISSVSILDLEDQPYRDWYEDGISTQEAANLVLDDADFDLA